MTGSHLGVETAPPVRGRLSVRPQWLSNNSVVSAWRKNHDILSNAGSLYAATILTSALGFVFWALAAHLFPPHAVGLGATATSAMAVLGTIGMFGLNTLLIGELPQRESKAELISAALIAAGVGSLTLGLGFALIAPLFSRSFANISGTPVQLVVFVAGVTLAGVAMVFDEATIGLLRGRIQLWRNFLFAIAKLLVLPVVALFLHDTLGMAIAVSWVAGIVLSMIVLTIQFLLDRQPVFHKPDWIALSGLRGLTAIHNWLNLAITVPWTLLPVLVTVAIGPSASAACSTLPGR